MFASHPLRRWTDPCLHCSATLDEEATLHAAPLRELGPTVIGRYAASAMTTWGDERDLAHFLPRILDIVATQDFSWPCVEVVFATLRHAHWHSWPEAEHAAIQDFLLAKWSTPPARKSPHNPSARSCAPSPKPRTTSLHT